MATKTALRRIARRCQAVHAEILDANKELNLLLAAVAPRLLDRPGVGPEVVGQRRHNDGDAVGRSEVMDSAAVAIVDLPSGRQSGRERRSAYLRWD